MPATPGDMRIGSNIAWLHPITVKPWRYHGWMRLAMQTLMDIKTTENAKCGPGGTGSSMRSIRTCPTTSSPSSNWPGIYCPCLKWIKSLPLGSIATTAIIPRRIHSTGSHHRECRGSGGNHLCDLDGGHHAVCPMPRSQIRPFQYGRILRALCHLP